MNPIIKFTTLFGLLGRRAGGAMTANEGPAVSRFLSALFFGASLLFVWRSFNGMRIKPGGRVTELSQTTET